MVQRGMYELNIASLWNGLERPLKGVRIDGLWCGVIGVDRRCKRSRKCGSLNELTLLRLRLHQLSLVLPFAAIGALDLVADCRSRSIDDGGLSDSGGSA